jgi:hypothetical protein
MERIDKFRDRSLFVGVVYVGFFELFLGRLAGGLSVDWVVWGR